MKTGFKRALRMNLTKQHAGIWIPNFPKFLIRNMHSLMKYVLCRLLSGMTWLSVTTSIYTFTMISIIRCIMSISNIGFFVFSGSSCTTTRPSLRSKQKKGTSSPPSPSSHAGSLVSSRRCLWCQIGTRVAKYFKSFTWSRYWNQHLPPKNYQLFSFWTLLGYLLHGYIHNICDILQL